MHNMLREISKTITRPTLLLDEVQAVKNIIYMVSKSKAHGKQFRPHFKTHQSAEIGGWFRKAGVKTITVSSVSMANRSPVPLCLYRAFLLILWASRNKLRTNFRLKRYSHISSLCRWYLAHIPGPAFSFPIAGQPARK